MKKLTQEEFINRAIVRHGSRYDYSHVNYINTDTKVCIVCPEHGGYLQTPHMHLQGQGCPKCNGNEPYTNETFIEKANKIHNNKYDYSKTNYIGINNKVCIVCPNHGIFYQTPHHHLNGVGCPECNGKRKYTNDLFIERAVKIHGDKFDYSLVSNIKNNRSKVDIICPTHGVFRMTIDNHLNQKQGCPKCKSSKLESMVREKLIENNITFEEQKKFEWLGLQRLDFFLPEHNIAIECQGDQHFIPSNFGSKKIKPQDALNLIVKRDLKKYQLCKENNIEVLYFSNSKLKLPQHIFKNFEELLNFINI